MYKVLLTTPMEQQAVTNPVVIHGLCAMTKCSEINTALLAQARPLMMNHLTSSLLWSCVCSENEILLLVLLFQYVDLLSKLFIFILFTVNCLDRHVAKDPSAVAVIWEKNTPGKQEEITYKYVCCNSAVENILNVNYTTILHVLYFSTCYITENFLSRPVR